MLLTLLIWIWITIFCYIYGSLTVRILNTLFGFENKSGASLPIILILGVCVLGTIASYFSIFMKIGLAVNIILISTALIYVLFDRKRLMADLKVHLTDTKNINIPSLAVFIALFLIILFETSIYIPKNFDTALYHAQAIHWIEKFKAIPGLGNFHKNLAYNNGWFLPCALFSFSFIKAQSFHVLNGIFFLFGAFYFLKTADGFFRGENRLGGLISFFVIPIAVYLYTNFASSPGTDMPTSIIIWVIFLLFINKIGERKSYEFDIISVLIVIFSSYLITVKLTGAPLFLFALYIIAIELFKGKIRPSLLILLSGLIIFPWIVRNVIISGYAVYPVIQTGFFNVDWKMPEYIIQDDINGIRDWSFPIGNMPVLNYLPLWLKGLNIQYKYVIWPLFTLMSLSLIYYFTAFFFHIKKLPLLIIKYKNYLICYLTALGGTMFLFYSAPDVRYGAGIFSVFSLLVFLPALIRLIKNSSGHLMLSKIYSALLIVFMIAFEVFLFNRYFFIDRHIKFLRDHPSDIKNRILVPADYGKSPNGVSEFTIDNKFKFFIPKISTADCWYEPFPSTSKVLGKLELRGESIEDGFRNKDQ